MVEVTGDRWECQGSGGDSWQVGVSGRWGRSEPQLVMIVMCIVYFRVVVTEMSRRTSQIVAIILEKICP